MEHVSYPRVSRVSPREPPRQTPGLSPSSFGQKTSGQDARHSNESLAISGFSRGIAKMEGTPTPSHPWKAPRKEVPGW